MKLNELLSDFSQASPPPLEIRSLTDNTANANADSLLVCIHGVRFNGHDLAHRAYENGCRAFVCSEPVTLPPDAYILTVEDTRHALSLLACRFYGFPARSMKLIGITGTKGKTTVASLLSDVLTRAGIPCGYIGTNGACYQDVHIPLKNTTPDPLTLQRLLFDMREGGIRTVVMEISSQAVYQSRIAGMTFDTCVFTNLYSDHVGPTEHPTFEHYKACKHRLFTDFSCRTMISNADDPHAEEMQKSTTASHIVRFSMHDPKAVLYAYNVLPILTEKGYGISFCITENEKMHTVSLPLLGRFNASNALAVIATARECFGLSLEGTAKLLRDATVTGRTEAIKLKSGAYAVIDYAHNGASLSAVLKALREYKPRRLICLFGSVGERSFLRRRELGHAAATLSDLAILTSDNPGEEDPMAIISEIAREFEGTKTPYLAIPDRAEAIRRAVALTQEGDILLLAGKGHENYQLIGKEKIPFSERALLDEN